MLKAVLSGSFGFDDHVAAIVPAHSRGIDAGWSEKRAAAPLFDFAKIAREAKPGEALVHLLALGDGETVGANRNGDYFPKAANAKYHSTFLKAHYFHDHVNKNPERSFGRVVAAAHNVPMGRVELIVGIDEKKAAADLDELEKRGEFPVSMSCRVPYDECMVCGNRAKSRNEYCKHASLMMGQIMPDGKQAAVRNDHPDFFDISKVRRGADRVAWTFRKLSKAASYSGMPGGAELAEILQIADTEVPTSKSLHSSRKKDVLRKMAHVAGSEMRRFCNALRASDVDDERMAILKSGEAVETVLYSLHRDGVCLPVASFLQLTGIDKMASLSCDNVRAAIRDTLAAAASDDATAARICDNGTYDGRPGVASAKVAHAVRSLKPELGLRREDAYARIVGSAAKAGVEAPVLAKAAGNLEPQEKLAAEEYVAYLVSLAQADERYGYASDEFVENLTALRALV